MLTQDKESDTDPFLCSCGPCKKFWKDNFSEAADLLRQSSLSRAEDTATLSKQSNVIRIGDRVLVHGKSGTVKYVGVVDDNAIAPQLYVGVKLDDNVNSPHNGVFKGKRYFHCPRGHGAMVRYTEVRPLRPADSQPPLQGNYMFPSWEEVKMRRKERNEKLAAIYLKAGVSPPPETGSTNSIPALLNQKYKTEPKIHLSDPHDIALQDMAKREEIERRRIKTLQTDRDKQETRKIHQQFGGGPNAERMSQTLQKLKNAYQEGLNITRRRSNWEHDPDISDDASNL